MSEKNSKWYFSDKGEIFGPLEPTGMRDAIYKGRVKKKTMISCNDSDWSTAESHPEILAILQRMEAKRQEERRTRLEKLEKERLHANRDITVSTSNAPPGKYYEIIDTLFALEADGGTPGLFHVSDGNPQVAFERIKASLESNARTIGADAVVNCQFEYRIAVGGQSVFGEQYGRVVEFFGYGTAIRYVDKI